MRSWFTYYKWEAGGEVWVPRLRPFLDASPRDYIWFAFDLVLCGGAQLLRVELEASQGRQELWFDSDKTITFNALPPQVVEYDWTRNHRVPVQVAKRWLQAATTDRLPT